MPVPKKETTISLSYGRPMHSIFADHFVIRKNQGMVDLDYRCERSNENLTVRMTGATLDGLKVALTSYLHRLEPATSPTPTQVQLPSSQVVTADWLEMARNGEMAEFCFHAVNWKYALDATRSDADKLGNEVAYYVASVRCNVETQRHWIAALYLP